MTSVQDLQLSAEERAMMGEVFGIFEKYAGKTREFGLNLVHSHFPILDSEILLETHSRARRTHHVRTVKRKLVGSQAIATAWKKDAHNLPEVTMLCCDSTPVTPPGR